MLATIEKFERKLTKNEKDEVIEYAEITLVSAMPEMLPVGSAVELSVHKPQPQEPENIEKPIKKD